MKFRRGKAPEQSEAINARLQPPTLALSGRLGEKIPEARGRGAVLVDGETRAERVKRS